MRETLYTADVSDDNEVLEIKFDGTRNPRLLD
jgi:hypothetical protein